MSFSHNETAQNSSACGRQHHPLPTSAQVTVTVTSSVQNYAKPTIYNFLGAFSMLPRLSLILRPLHSPPSPAAFSMARAITGATQLPICPTTNNVASILSSLHSGFVHFTNRLPVSLSSKSSLFGRRFHVLCRGGGKHLSAFGGARAEQRGYRKTRKRIPKNKKKELELTVDICIEEDLPDDDEILVYRASILRF